MPCTVICKWSLICSHFILSPYSSTDIHAKYLSCCRTKSEKHEPLRLVSSRETVIFGSFFFHSTKKFILQAGSMSQVEDVRPSVYVIPRSREVGQSYFTSIWTTSVAIMSAFTIVSRSQPDVVSDIALLKYHTRSWHWQERLAYRNRPYDVWTAKPSNFGLWKRAYQSESLNLMTLRSWCLISRASWSFT